MISCTIKAYGPSKPVGYWAYLADEAGEVLSRLQRCLIGVELWLRVMSSGI